MAQNLPIISQEYVFVECRALVFLCSRENSVQEWIAVGENGVYSSVRLIQQSDPLQRRVLKILGLLETSGQVTVDVLLQPSITYTVIEPTWHLLIVNRQHVYGLKLSPESDGGRFSVVVQNSLKSLPVTGPLSNSPILPREAWAPITSQSPLSPQLISDPNSPISPAVGNVVYQFDTSRQKPASTMASHTLPVRSPGLASPGTPRVVPVNQVQNQTQLTEEEVVVDSLCEALSAAIARGDISQASEVVKSMASKKLSLNIELKNPLKTSVDGGNDKTLKLRVVVEDSETSGGAFHLDVSLKTKIEKLQQEVEEKYGFPTKVQRWIIGQKMAKGKDTLSQLGVKQTGFTAYLYLISGKSVGLTRKDIEALKQYKPPSTEQDTVTVNGEGVRHASLERDIETLQVQTVAAGLQRAASMPMLFAGNQTRTGPQAEGAGLARNEPLAAASMAALPTHPELEAAIPYAPAPQLIAEAPAGTGPLQQHQSISDLRQFFDQNQEPGLNNGVQPPGQGGLIPEPQSHGNPVEDTEVVRGWGCPQCTYFNTPTRPGCEICGTPRPADYVVPQNVPLCVEEKIRLEQEALQTQLFFEAQEKQRMQQAVERQQNFNALLQTAQQNLIINQEEFECAICFTTIEPGEGVVLRECLHRFCKECLQEHIRNCTEPEVQCPFQDDQFACHFIITAQEIKALLSAEDFNKLLNRSLATAESQAANSFHCKTPNCPGWCIYEDNVNTFHCEVCRKVNCLTCKAIHYPEMNCREYQEDLKRRAENDVAARQTQQFLEHMIEEGDAMKCPQCEIILLKKDGCDWMRCTMCRLEICWATRGPRWGPEGTGDLTGGCKCRVGGKKCHPQCRNCH